MSINEILITQDNILRQQDSQLNTLSNTVGNLHSLSTNIRDELRSQGTLLSELENGMDTTQKKFTLQISKIKLLKKKNKTCKLFLLTIFSVVILCVVLYIILSGS